jgi:hypothetical protein
MDFQYTMAAGNNFGIGEYHQLVATDHTALAFWADGRTNDEDLNIYMAKVNLNNPATGVQELGPHQPADQYFRPLPYTRQRGSFHGCKIGKGLPIVNIRDGCKWPNPMV